MESLVSKKDDDSVSDNLRFVVLGLPYTGKTSLVHRLKTGEKLENHDHTFDTEGYALDDQYGFQVGATDYGSRGSHRFFFVKLACYQTVGIIYMIDSSDTEQLTESLELLNELLKNGEISSNKTVMVVANKQDLNDAVGPEVIEENVKKICKIRKDISMFVMPMSTSADDDHSLQLAYRLFLKTMVRKRRNKKKYQPGLTRRAWETAEKVVEDSDADDGDDKGKDKEGDSDKKKKKSFFKDPIHTFKSLLIH